ncbi:MAG: hypothetical protein ACUZ8E_03825 [Candidatus Anammoxibacter sp.]
MKVIVLKDEKVELKKVNMIDHLLDSPLKINSFKPLTREEVYEPH